MVCAGCADAGYTQQRTDEMKLETYKDLLGEWRWRIKSRGRKIANGGEGYKRKSTMLRTIAALAKRLPKLIPILLIVGCAHNPPKPPLPPGFPVTELKKKSVAKKPIKKMVLRSGTSFRQGVVTTIWGRLPKTNFSPASATPRNPSIPPLELLPSNVTYDKDVRVIWPDGEEYPTDVIVVTCKQKPNQGVLIEYSTDLVGWTMTANWGPYPSEQIVGVGWHILASQRYDRLFFRCSAQ
jgi:uncharacterized protein YegP (UPF0339 family)